MTQDFTHIVKQCGRFKLRWGYNATMSLDNVTATLEVAGADPYEVGQVLAEMTKANVPALELASFLADYYQLFGW